MKVRHLAHKGTSMLAAAALLTSLLNCAPSTAGEGLATGEGLEDLDSSATQPDLLENDFDNGVENVTALALESCGSQPTPAFPGAIGYGRNATGGRGGRVVFVTNTNDSGPGSLRQALEVETGRRIVVFKVGGVLVAKKQIEVRHGNVTIAGQTAPGNGFAMIGARIRVVSSNVIVRGMKIRPGDGPGDIPRNRDALSVGFKDRVTENVIIDHNSLTWAVDETLTAWYANKNITFSYNLIGEPLYDSIHVDEPKPGQPPPPPKPHGMGTLISDDVDRISVARNVYVSANGRNPLIRATSGEVINNYVYNYGDMGTASGGTAPTTIHVINNYYQEGPDTYKSRTPIFLEGAAGFDHYVSGNLSSKFRPSLGQSEAPMLSGGGASKNISKPVFAASQTPIMLASEVRAHLAANVGARWPIFDSVDSRIVDQALKGTGRRIDKVSQVGGMPTYPKGTAPTDSDDDGIPDSVEKVIGSNPFVKDDSGDVDGDGYTNVEEYINGLITGMDPNTCGTSPAPEPTPAPTPTPTPAPGPAPTPAPPTSPAPGLVMIEAETMTLSGGFRVVKSSVASGGKWIQSTGKASAKIAFPGASGRYDIGVTYFDENDGVSTMSFKVNGVTLKTWKWNKNLGSPSANASTQTHMVIPAVTLKKGDVIQLSGSGTTSEPMRTDFIEFDPIR